MDENVVQEFERQIKRRMQYNGLDLDAAVLAIIESARIMGGLREGHHECLSEARGRISAALQNVEYLRITNIRRHRQLWYPGPDYSSDSFWGSFVEHLRTDTGWPEDAVTDADRSSTKVLSLLDNPGLLNFDTRGLVVGYVQSGKTANLTSVIAKAADSNFRFFIVMAGMTNSLRLQTQRRLQQDLTSLSEDRWYLWTNEGSDFRESEDQGFPPLQSHVRQLAVIKKNAARLRRFLRKLQNTDPSILRESPFLIIDDECDHASVNSARYREEMTAINGLIRETLETLPRVSYIGYTATPFANVLIDPKVSVDNENPDDLYPRDFIVALPRSDDYFGPERLFGRDLLEADEEEPDKDGLDVIRLVPDEERSKLCPQPRVDIDEFSPEITPTLSEAIDYFLLSSVARDLRDKHGCAHSSMLVHTTPRIKAHERLRDVINTYIRGLIAEISRKDPSTVQRLRELWQSEQDAVDPGDWGHGRCSFDSLFSHLEQLLNEVRVVVENSEAEERLDFNHERTRYIVVGGAVLSRGLTIEGLVVSYFLRDSRQYDTLMQMGRWFGYRNGYEDLPRIWMTADMAEDFRDLATVEAEIRHDIEVYEKQELTPLEFAVRIRQLPGMAITSRNKMLYADQCWVSYANRHVQTRRFKTADHEWLLHNWNTGASLLEEVAPPGKQPEKTRQGLLFRSVPVGTIKRFLRTYRVHELHEDLNPEKIIKYIDSQNDSVSGPLRNWNVAVFQPINPNSSLSEQALGPLGPVKTVVRARLNISRNRDADIKALMSKMDTMIDVSDLPDLADNETWDSLKAHRETSLGQPAPPLLILYPIQATSRPRSSSKTRLPLDASMDVLGYGLLFPKTPVNTPVSYVRAPIEEADAELEMEIEDQTAEEEDI